jgi:hypothetical protein
MSTKGKGKADDTASVINDNEDKRTLTSVTTIIVIKLKKDTLIKIKELAMFTGERTKFAIYKTFINLAV